MGRCGRDLSSVSLSRGLKGFKGAAQWRNCCANAVSRGVSASRRARGGKGIGPPSSGGSLGDDDGGGGGGCPAISLSCAGAWEGVLFCPAGHAKFHCIGSELALERVGVGLEGRADRVGAGLEGDIDREELVDSPELSSVSSGLRLDRLLFSMLEEGVWSNRKCVECFGLMSSGS